MARTGEHSLSFTLDGTRFTVGRLAPRRAIRMSIRLGKIIGPGIGGAMSKLDLTKGVKGVGELEVSALVGQIDWARALGELGDRLTPQEFDAIHDEFLWNAVADLDGRTLPLLEHFDTIFDGRPFLSIQVLGKALSFTYGNFSSLLGTLSGGPAAPEASPTLRSA